MVFNTQWCYSNTFGCYFNTLWCYVQTLGCNFNTWGCGPLLTPTSVILTPQVFTVLEEAVHTKKSCIATPPVPYNRGGGGTYACSPSPEPPYLGKKDIPLISGIGYHWQWQKTPTFLSFLGKSSRDYSQKYPLSRENGNTHAAPLHAFEWGRRRKTVMAVFCDSFLRL